MSRFTLLRDILLALRDDVIAAWSVDECYIGAPTQEVEAPYATIELDQASSDWSSGGGNSTKVMMDIPCAITGIFANPPATENVLLEQTSRADELTKVFESSPTWHDIGMTPIVSNVDFIPPQTKDEYRIMVTFSIKVEAPWGA